MEEIWKPVVEFPNDYQISNYGRVKSNDRIKTFKTYNQYGEYYLTRPYKGKILKPRKIPTGYLRVGIEYKDYFIHRLVAEAFLGNISNLEINHIDGNKTNNIVSNLEIVTRIQNQDHAVLTDLNTMVGLARKISVNGVVYDSIGNASRAVGMSATQLTSRANGASGIYHPRKLKGAIIKWED